MRHIKAHLEFDLELAKKESSENPVYYIQYAYARINSINKKARELAISTQKENFNLLTLEEELDLVKHLGGFSDALIFCRNQLDPYPLVIYLFELATCFHKFYDCHRVIDDDIKRSQQRLGLVNAAQIVLAQGLSLLGISRPESM
jgi:arginyl-tRNA synthetase